MASLTSRCGVVATVPDRLQTRMAAPTPPCARVAPCHASTSYHQCGAAPSQLAQRRCHAAPSSVKRSARCCCVVPAHHSAGAESKVGVVIVDHGSRKKDSNQMLVEFVGLYGSMTGREIVEVAHMEIAKPSIEQAIDRCVERGAASVIVAPYFLSRGRHIQEDIPALVAEAQAKHPSLKCVIAEPIGIDPLMAQLIDNRVQAAMQQLQQQQQGQQAAAPPAAVVSAST